MGHEFRAWAQVNVEHAWIACNNPAIVIGFRTFNNAKLLMTNIESLLFGGVNFPEDEEYQRFQFRLLYALLLMGIFFSGLFILADRLQVNHLSGLHVRNNIAYFATCIVLTAALYGHKERFFVIAILTETASLLIYLSALILVPDDPSGNRSTHGTDECPRLLCYVRATDQRRIAHGCSVRRAVYRPGPLQTRE
ncbi:hypothetical protein [Gallionella capsiferriformans]|uniref:hypothetical protein n=1 Tax=Gallionella capsiferriformans TaxID=370405 RepID=UPI0001AB2764|nr:hypothetical protein [Gallionella capsiferriformans]